MFRSERFNLKDAVYLTVGVALCVVLLLVLIAVNRQRTVQQEVEAEQTDQQSIDRVIARLKSTYPAYTFSSACSCVNRTGYAQQWQTATDDNLPDDFQPGGVLRQIWSAEPATLTPFASRDVYATIVHQEIFEKLIWRNLDPPFEYVPGLAQSWSVSDDGRSVEFNLFTNATWSDGKRVTASDVVFTYNLIMNEAIAAPAEREILRDSVERCERVDEYTVRFTLNRSYYDSLGICGNRLWILPEHIYSTYTPQQFNSLDDVCIGSGPWTLKRWNRGRELVLSRNDNYWGPKPAIEQINVRFISSERQELELFIAGKVDVIGPTSSQWLHYLSSDELADIGYGISYETPLRGYTWLGYNVRLPMFDDARTRRALTMLLDRQKMIDSLLGGLGRIVTGPFHPHSAQYDTTIIPLAYDPDEAARLLREVGWRDTDGDGVLDRDLDGDGSREPFQFTFLIPSSQLGRSVQRYVKDQFARAGINVHLDEMQWSAYLARAAAGEFEMIMQRSNSGPEVDAYEYWHSSQIQSGRNYVGLNNSRVDDLIEQARTTMDRAPRMLLWNKVHRQLYEQQPQTFLWTTPRLVFVNHRIRGVTPRALRLYTSEWYITEPNATDN